MQRPRNARLSIISNTYAQKPKLNHCPLTLNLMALHPQYLKGREKDSLRCPVLRCITMHTKSFRCSFCQNFCPFSATLSLCLDLTATLPVHILFLRPLTILKFLISLPCRFQRHCALWTEFQILPTNWGTPPPSLLQAVSKRKVSSQNVAILQSIGWLIYHNF